jgi:hypothetical protein
MNALAQYLSMSSYKPITSAWGGFNSGSVPVFNSAGPEFYRDSELDRANLLRSRDIEAEDRRSMIEARNRFSQSFGQMPNFYGEGPRMPEYQQQPMYQFGGFNQQRQMQPMYQFGGFNQQRQMQPMYQFDGGFNQQRQMQPMGDNNASAFNALAALARRGS